MKSICQVIFIFSILTLIQSYEYQAFTRNKMNLDGWSTQYSIYSGPEVLNCDSEKQLGFNYVRQTLFKQFDLPPHYKIIINVKTWKIYIPQYDIVWPTNETVIGYLDDNQFDNHYHYENAVSKKYGQGSCYPNDKNSKQQYNSLNFQYEFIHRANTAFVIFTTNTYREHDTKYWGISDFKLTISECPEGCSFCYNQNDCGDWQKITSTLLSLTENQFSLQGWDSKLKRIVKCQSLIFFGSDKQNIKTNQNEIKTFKIGKIKPYHHFKIQFLFAILDYQKQKLKLQITGPDYDLYKRVFEEKNSYQHDLCEKNQDFYQIFFRDQVTLDTEFDQKLPEQITFQVNEGSTDPAPYVWGIRDIQVFVQYCPENCLKCRDFTSCIDCQENYIWDYYKQICVEDNFQYIQNIRQFSANKFTEIDGWILKNNIYGIQVGTCQVSLVGGLNILGLYGRASRKFKLETHIRVRIILNIYLFGDWENQSININVDGALQKNIIVSSAQLKEKVCNSDQLIKTGILKTVIIDLNHKNEYILVDIYAKIDDYKNQASWGFRDFTIQTFQKFVCATLFTQIDYKGEDTQICQQGDGKFLISSDIQSIKVPQYSQIILTTDSQEEITILADTPSLDNKKFTLAKFSVIEQNSNDLQNEIDEAVEAVESVESVESVEAIKDIEAVKAVEAVAKAVEAVDTIE